MVNIQLTHKDLFPWDSAFTYCTANFNFIFVILSRIYMSLGHQLSLLIALTKGVPVAAFQSR